MEYVGIVKSLFFGFRGDRGINRATPEKAFLDTLYFYLHGRCYSFDIYQDIDITRLDRRLIEQWLIKYDNLRFVSFVKDILTIDIDSPLGLMVWLINFFADKFGIKPSSREAWSFDYSIVRDQLTISTIPSHHFHQRMYVTLCLTP